MLSTGIDLIEVERIAGAIERYGQRFLQRIYTNNELEQVGDIVGSLAARWAAKEAVAKALSTGIGRVSWVEVEILRGANNEPCLYLHGNAARIAAERQVDSWAISLSHTRKHAIAMVVAQKRENSGQLND